MIYYKVVGLDLGSYIIDPEKNRRDIYDKFHVKYQVNKWVRPRVKGTKLMVFNNKYSAIGFLKSERFYGKVFTCKTINPRSIYDYPLIVDCQYLDNFYKVISENVKKHKKRSLVLNNITKKYLIPDNTIVCDAVKLLDEIYTNAL